MFERFTDDARAAVAQAQDHARRLGHSRIGCEHLLLSLVSGGSPASAALRENGVTPVQVEEQIVRLVGLGGDPGLDRDALAAIGIDLDQVSTAVDATFGKDALARAGAGSAGRRPSRGRSGVRRRWCRWRARHGSRRRGDSEVARLPVPHATGRYRAAVPGPGGHLPFTARAKQVLERSVRESQSHHDRYIGAQHLGLALIGSKEGLVRRILSALGTSPAALVAAINDRYREAS